MNSIWHPYRGLGEARQDLPSRESFKKGWIVKPPAFRMLQPPVWLTLPTLTVPGPRSAQGPAGKDKTPSRHPNTSAPDGNDVGKQEEEADDL